MIEILLFDIREMTVLELSRQIFSEPQDLWKERIQKTFAYKFQEDKFRCIGGTLLMKHIFDQFQISYTALRSNTYGKYFIENSDLYFNLSHSGDYVVIAYGEASCGIDIEQKTDALHLAEKFFCHSEAKYCTTPEAFTRMWTMKEAYMKEIGKGLYIPLNSFEIIPGILLDDVKELTQIREFPQTCIQHDAERNLKQFYLKGYGISVCSKAAITDKIQKIRLKQLLSNVC